MNYVSTIGCPYRLKNDSLIGCSMCDYQSDSARLQGSLLALRKKAPEKYAEIVRTIFQNTRGKNVAPNAIENVSGFDTLDPLEFPEELLEKMYGNALFSSVPFAFNIETRASSITQESMDRLNAYFHKRKRIYIEFGVETGDEWLRNHWLNKGITDQQIVNSIGLLHDNGYKAIGNVLIGIPGLTEEEAIHDFLNSVCWLISLGIDRIVVFPLNRKKYTLQGFLHDHLSEHPTLSDLGLVNGEHTGLPWIFTIIEAMIRLYEYDASVYSKVVFAEVSQASNSIHNEIIYNEKISCSCRERLLTYINDLAISKDYSSLANMRAQLSKDPCFSAYKQLLEKQAGHNKQETIWHTGRALAQSLFPECWEGLFDLFEIEWQGFRG